MGLALDRKIGDVSLRTPIQALSFCLGQCTTPQNACVTRLKHSPTAYACMIHGGNRHMTVLCCSMLRQVAAAVKLGTGHVGTVQACKALA